MTKLATKRAFFTDDQKAFLAKSYENSPYPTSAHKEALASLMKKPTKHIGNWFKNERARQIKNPNEPTRNLALKNILEVEEEHNSIILEKIVKKTTVQSDLSAVPSLETIPEIPISPFTEEEINVSVSESSLKGRIPSTPLPEQEMAAANDTFSKLFFSDHLFNEFLMFQIIFLNKFSLEKIIFLMNFNNDAFFQMIF